ncbi:hypothetical protein [Streptomyces sp. NBC_00040]|nr:hypothetical protein [Streptomyces sp. NBC_00160]
MDDMTKVAPDVVEESGTGTGRTAAGREEREGRTARTGRGGIPEWATRRRVLFCAEILVSLAAALGYTLLCGRIDVNPMIRVAQVSGLAKMQQYAALLGIPILALLLYTAHRGSLMRHQLVKRLVCAALAGLSTGVVAGGVVVALNGTPWALGGQEGDPSVLIDMGTSFLRGEGMSGIYPPAFPALIAVWAKLRHGGTLGSGMALQDLQIFFTAIAGPMAYAAWRLLLRPFWALLIAVPSAVLFIDPIRPYSHGTMIVLLPLLGYWLREMRRAEHRTTRRNLVSGILLGLVFGALFLWYSGWYVWAAPGVGLLALFLFPWRGGARKVKATLVYIGATVATAAVVGAPLLYQMVRLGADNPDRYAFLSVYADPAYVLGWVSDRSGGLTYRTWPVSGEMAGQTGFTLLLLFGAGLGIGLGLRNIMVRTAAAVLAGAWLARFWFASHMVQAKAVQLYPRTTWIIMYCLMILAVLGLMVAVDRGSGWLERTVRPRSADGDGDGAPRGPVLPRRAVQQLSAGMVCVLALFATMGASWSVNRYMPDKDEKSMGVDAWRAHTLKKPNGTCPRFAPVKDCADVKIQNWKPTADRGYLWCGGLDPEEWPAVCGRRAPKD